MATVRAVDHALPNGKGSPDSVGLGAAGGMANDEKAAVAGLVSTDASKGGAVHVSYPVNVWNGTSS